MLFRHLGYNDEEYAESVPTSGILIHFFRNKSLELYFVKSTQEIQLHTRLTPPAVGKHRVSTLNELQI